MCPLRRWCSVHAMKTLVKNATVVLPTGSVQTSVVLDGDRIADIEYLRVLHLAARTMESEVAEALEILLDSDQVPRSEDVKDLVAPESPDVPELLAPVVDLKSYDELLGAMRGTGS